MTATEALTHPWFTNSCHLATFDAVYENSIRNWRPHCPVSALVEPISQLSPEFPESVVSDKFLTKEVVPRYFAPSHQSSSSGRYDSHGACQFLVPDSRLSSIEEEVDARCTPSDQRSSPPSYHPVEGVRPHQQSVDLSASRKSVSIAIRGKYAKDNGTTKHNEPLVAKSSDDIYAGFNSIYRFSIPDPPPRTPEVERESVLVPETPVRSVKRQRGKQGSYNLVTSSEPEDDAKTMARGQRPLFFARLQTKRTKLRH